MPFALQDFTCSICNSGFVEELEPETSGYVNLCVHFASSGLKKLAKRSQAIIAVCWFLLVSYVVSYDESALGHL